MNISLSTHDTTRIDDTRISAVRPLITPALLEETLPVTDAAQALVEGSRAAISHVLHGQDDRLIVVVGEMLSNVSRHAHATHVGVDVTVGDVVMVTGVDDGVGWGDAPTVGAGISNMVDRARRHGGWMVPTCSSTTDIANYNSTTAG